MIQNAFFKQNKGRNALLGYGQPYHYFFCKLSLLFFSTSLIFFLPINGPYTIIFTVNRYHQDQIFFHRKKGFYLFETFFSSNCRISSAELYVHSSVAVLVVLHFKNFPENSISAWERHVYFECQFSARNPFTALWFSFWSFVSLLSCELLCDKRTTSRNLWYQSPGSIYTIVWLLGNSPHHLNPQKSSSVFVLLHIWKVWVFGDLCFFMILCCNEFV